MPVVPRAGQPRVINRVITRGLGARRGTGRASLVAVGGGGLRQFYEYVRRTAGSGVKYVKENVENIVVWARLISVNGIRPKEPIQGKVTVSVDLNRRIAVLAEKVSHRVRSAWEDFKITIKRVK